MVRFDLITQATVTAVSVKFIDATKTAKNPSVIVSFSFVSFLFTSAALGIYFFGVCTSLTLACAYHQTQKIMSAIMYIMGHQQRDVSEWAKCRKLITHHLFKEMKMIEVRSKLKVHKLKLAKECITGLEAGDIATGVCLSLSLFSCLRLCLWASSTTAALPYIQVYIYVDT